MMVCQPMPPSEPLRVFISHARKDGPRLAQRLQSDLSKEGFDAWLDTQRIAGGAVWTAKIEHEIDTCQVMIARILHRFPSHGSYSLSYAPTLPEAVHWARGKDTGA